MKVLATLPSLTNLNLSYCELQNIEFDHTSSSVNSTFFTSLEYLDISYNRLTGPQSLSVLRNMTSLKLLDLSSNNLISSIPAFLRDFKKLGRLDLRFNHFDSFEAGSLMSLLDCVCSLKSLDLSFNQIQSLVLETSYNSSSHCANYDLEFLDLSYNYFYGPISPSFGKLTSLTYLNAQYNNLNGTIPELSTSLKRLDLSFNSLSGSFPHSFGKLTSLTSLNVLNNNLNGTIPNSLGKLLSLEELILNGNQLVGTIPDSVGDLSLLTNLNLSNNRLTGDVPKSLGNLSHLVNLDVSSNSLQGIVSEAHFANLSNLRYLRIGDNNLSCKMRSDWIPPFSLVYVHMGGCKVGTRFPEWLRTQNEATFLNLSNANIVGAFPNWLQEMPLPSPFGALMPGLEMLNLGSNLISGSIPKQLCKLDQLYLLDLSSNILSGEIPDCWTENNSLNVINLSDNKLSGTIPNSIGHISSLKWLHVNNNNLSGALPLALENCRALEVMDLSGNQLSGAIPYWISADILRLRDNKFTGNIPMELCMLSNLHILDLANNFLGGEILRCFNRFTLSFLNNIDLSCNHLQGFIPEELFELFGLKGLNLSYNHLSGNIPNQIGNLKSLESLDLSNNKLSSPIPSTLSELTMLAHLNLSNNNLSGRVPTGNQLQTLNEDPSIYAGNPLLCGDTLPHKCSDDGDKSERIWLYLAIFLGYATGLWVVMVTLWMKRKWRMAYFRSAENAKDRIIVIAAVKMARLKKMMNKAEE